MINKIPNKIKCLNRIHLAQTRKEVPIFALSGHSFYTKILLILIAPHCFYQMSLALSAHTIVQLYIKDQKREEEKRKLYFENIIRTK